MATRPTIAQSRQVAALLKQFEPQIERAFLEAVRAARNSVDVKALIAALEASDVERAVQILRLDQAILYPLHDAVRGAYIAGGLSVGTTLPTAIRGGFGFNGRHPRAEDWVKRVGGELIQGIAEDTLAMTRNTIISAMTEGRGAQVVARDIVGRMVAGKRQGGFLGLTSQQADSIITGRAKLASGDPALMREYLGLKLRNRNYDAMIKRAIDAGRPITGADLDKIIQAHKDKALGYRGKMIAKNEVFTAQAAGREEGYRQVLDRGDVEAIIKRWQHGLSERPRADHLALDGTVIDMAEDFVMGDGTRMAHPHDPRGGADHSIGCRCVCVYRVVISKN